MKRKTAQTLGLPGGMCPQAAPLLALPIKRHAGTGAHAQALDFKVNCIACFVIDLFNA